MHSFLEKDILQHISHLPSIQLGFEMDDPTAVTESVSREDHNIQTVDESTVGVDYHKELEHLHRNFKHPDNVTATDLLADSITYDTLKRGNKLSDDDVNIIAKYNSSSHEAPSTEIKYRKFIKTHIAKHHLDFDTPASATMTEDEINSIPRQWHHAGLRVFTHAGGVITAEHHPVHGLQLVSHPDIHRIGRVFEAISTEANTQKTHADLVKSTNIVSPAPFVAHGIDSSPTNKFLAFKHNGNIVHDEINGIPTDDIQKHIKEMDDEFALAHTNIAHGKPLTVYTGVYGHCNIARQGRTDEQGNIYFHNPCYTSTSLDVKTADTFAKPKRATVSDTHITSRPVKEIISLTVPEWYPHAKYIGGVSGHASERELLLNRGQTFKLHPNPLYLSMSHSDPSNRVWLGSVVPHDTDHALPFHAKSNANKIIHMMTNPSFDKDALWDLANNHSNVGVRSVAAYHPNFPTERVTVFAEHPADVRTAMLAKRITPHHIIDAAIAAGHTSDMNIVARRETLHPRHFDELFDTQYPSTHAELAQRNDLSDRQVDKLYEAAKYDVPMLSIVARNPAIGQQRIHDLSHHPDVKVRAGVAHNPTIPHHTLRRMADGLSSTDHKLREAIWTSPNYMNFKETK